MDIDYLDDNYSDRVELAQKILGNDSVYFDSSNYGKTESLSIAVPVTEINKSRNLVAGGIAALTKEFAMIATTYQKIAISGNSLVEVRRVLLTALAKTKVSGLIGVHLLYIGHTNFKAEIKQAAEGKGARFSFAELPDTRE